MITIIFTPFKNMTTKQHYQVKLADMRTIGKQEKRLEWTVTVHDHTDDKDKSEEDTRVVINTYWGQVGGKMQNKDKVISEGKGVGKGKRTIVQQALLEAKQLVVLKKRKGYKDLDKDGNIVLNTKKKKDIDIQTSSVKKVNVQSNDVDSGKAVKRKRKDITNLKSSKRSLDIFDDDFYKSKDESKEVESKEDESTDDDDTEVAPLPMLATEYEKRKKIIAKAMNKLEESERFVWVQPKIDGIRCVVNLETGSCFTRTGMKMKTLRIISKEAIKLGKRIGKSKDVKEMWLDGEVMGPFDFHTNNGLVRKTKDITETDWANLDEFALNVFDVIHLNDLTLHFKDRIQVLGSFKDDEFEFSKLKPFEHLRGVPTKKMVYTEDNIRKYHDLNVKDGEEGAMIRLMGKDGLYKVKGRSRGLIKVKVFIDDEFKVIGFQQEEGSEIPTLGSIRFAFGDGREFNASISSGKGTRELKKEIWENRNMYMGKKLTVKYFGMKDGNLPRFPVVKGLRIEEMK